MAGIPNDIRNYVKLDLLLARSCIVLRQLFKNRYLLFNGGQAWCDSSDCGSNYLVNAISKNKKFNLTTVQKTLIHNGDSNQWDLTTLTMILLNTDRPKTIDTTRIQQLNNEDQLMIELRNIRNTLAHHASKSINDTEFQQLWAKLTGILVAFGETREELDKLKNDKIFDYPTESINNLNVQEVLRLNSLGTQAHKERKFMHAIDLFLKAVDIPDVSNYHRTIVYSNMSASRLALHDEQVNLSNISYNNYTMDQRYLALRDAKEARMLSPTSWQGYFRVGKAYASLSEHEKAIDSFERAIALDPNNKKVKEALNESQHVQYRQSRNEHFDARSQPITMGEHLNEMNEKYGMDPQQIRSVHKLLETVDSVAANVVQGHKYEHGDLNTEQNYEQAAKHFAKAARQGNAEGLYNLARLTDRGLGVKKDPQLATKLFEQAAGQSPEHPRRKGIPNVGVAESEHSLGLRYAEGVFVSKNYSTAAQWYQRAVDHGSAEAANNLALMYLDGVGVEKNMEKAKQLFQLSARRGDSKAMMNLAFHLLKTDDLAMAKVWLDRACEAGNLYAQMQRNDFESNLRKRQQVIEETMIFSDFLTNMKSINELLGESNQYDLDALDEYAKRGSITAKNICKALRHFHAALNILMQSKALSDEEESIFIHEFAQCCLSEHTVAVIADEKIDQRIMCIIDRVLQRCRRIPNLTDSQLDENAHVCYVVSHMDSPKRNLKFLNSCKHKYAKSLFFLEFSAAMNVKLGLFEHSLNDVYTGLKIDPNHYELLYLKAMLFVVIGKDISETIGACEKFLLTAPKDHSKVPDLYYTMANCYMSSGEDDQTMDLVEELYKKGQEAEKIQLPCFLPYKSDAKTTLQSALNDCYKEDVIQYPISDNRSRLTDPHRIDIFKRHREWSAYMSKNKNNTVNHIITQTPRLKQRTAKSLVGLKPISLKEINPTKDHVYKGYILFVTIIDEALTWRPSIHLVIEDNDNDCDHLVVYGFNENQGQHLIHNVFTIGTQMHIVNPYLRIGANDGKPFIRVDDFSSIIFQNESERVVNMCRCCGQPNASHVCSRCKRARYCTKECQTIDWKLYEHKLICKNQ